MDSRSGWLYVSAVVATAAIAWYHHGLPLALVGRSARNGRGARGC